MTLRQQQPVVAGMFDQSAAGLDQPLLQAGERPGGDPRRQRQPAPQVPQVIGDDAQPEPYPRRLYRDELDGPEPGGGALLQQAWYGGTTRWRENGDS